MNADWDGSGCLNPLIWVGLAEVQRLDQGPVKGRSWLGSDAKRLAVGLGPD